MNIWPISITGLLLFSRAHSTIRPSAMMHKRETLAFGASRQYHQWRGRTQPFQGSGRWMPQTQGSLASSATLGFEAESRWDSRAAKRCRLTKLWEQRRHDFGRGADLLDFA